MADQSTLIFSHSGASAAAFAQESQGLQRHLRQCGQANGTWHTVRCAGERVDDFLSGRVVSMVVVASGLLAVSAYW